MKSAYLTEELQSRACFCIGPQNGEPLCPCQMQGVTVKDGRYVMVKDLGPVRPRPKIDLSGVEWSGPKK